MSSNDMAPHGSIIQISWEIHEKRPDGSFFGNAKDKGSNLFVIPAEDRALVKEYTDALIELIRRKTKNVSELEISPERLGQARIQRTSEPRDDNPKLFSMRGTIGGNPTGGP